MKTHPKDSARRSAVPRIERLEPRSLLAAQPLGSLGGGPQSLDGTGNNLANSEWGSSLEAFLRTAGAEYADGASLPAGATRPNARLVSNLLAADPEGGVVNDRDLSAIVYAWGQFLDHDLTLTLSADPAESLPIDVPAGDAWFDPAGLGTASMPFSRSAYDPSTGLAAGTPRQQVNSLSAFIDGSQVYGSTVEVAASLRTFSGGRMATSAGDLLPLADDGFGYAAGDIRVNENPGLVSLHTLFVREHNRLADNAAVKNPSWSDEQLYQHARRLVIAELQAITFNEFLPALVGRGTPAAQQLAAWTGYRADVDPGISNEFAAAAYRLGHSLLGSEVGFLDDMGDEVRAPLALRDAFFNTTPVAELGIDPVLKYLASDRAQELDTIVVDDVRNFLFGPPGSGGFDLAALNIQRGRDHGLADYNDVRAAYGLPRVKTFAEITDDPAVRDALAGAYGGVDDLDLWVAGLAERHLPGSSLGETFTRIIVDQFTRLKSGDRYWYQNVLPRHLAREVGRTTLADVIRRNTGLRNLQADMFVFDARIGGTVFGDTNRDGRLQRQERPLAGVVLTLLDAVGRTVGQTTSDARGRYEFTGLEVGRYRVHVSQPAGGDDLIREVTVTRGGRLEADPIGVTPRAQPRTTPRTAAFALLAAAAVSDSMPSVTPSRPSAGSIAVR